MELNIGKALIEEIKKVDIGDFIKEISERLEKMGEELVIDRFEGDIAICEDRKTGKIKEIKKDNLPENIQEGSVLKYQNGKYIKDEEKHREIEERIEKKMKDLWN